MSLNMSRIAKKKDLIFFLLASLACLICHLSPTATSEALFTLDITTLLWIIFRNASKGTQNSRDSAVILSIFIITSLLFYRILFLFPVAPSFLETKTTATLERNFQISSLLLFFFLLGSLGASSLRCPEARFATPTINSRSNAKLYYFVAWIPIFLLIISYFIFWRGESYAALQADLTGVRGLIFKTIYISFGAVINLGLEEKRLKLAGGRLLFLSLGYIFTFGLLYQVRSPIFFYLLLVYYFWGNWLTAPRLALTVGALILLFGSIAILRDPTLASTGDTQALFGMLVGLGYFPDTIGFTLHYIRDHGISYGTGIISDLIGLGTPLANLYALTIDPTYARRGGGFGFFFISDYIYNFGVYGSTILLTITGFTLSRLNFSKRTGVQIVAAALFANTFAIFRNDVGSSLRGSLYVITATVALRAFARLFPSALPKHLIAQH